MIEKKLYKKIQEVLPICCVDLVIRNNKGEFLLLKRKNKPAKGEWWFVGGRIEKGETVEKAALRKAKEEAGLAVALKGILGVGDTIFQRGFFGKSAHTINITFLALAKTKKVKIDDQSNCYKWFKKIDKKFNPYVKKFLSANSTAKHIKLIN